MTTQGNAPRLTERQSLRPLRTVNDRASMAAVVVALTEFAEYPFVSTRGGYPYGSHSGVPIHMGFHRYRCQRRLLVKGEADRQYEVDQYRWNCGCGKKGRWVLDPAKSYETWAKHCGHINVWRASVMSELSHQRLLVEVPGHKLYFETNHDGPDVYQTRPGDPVMRWTCSCGGKGQVWLHLKGHRHAYTLWLNHCEGKIQRERNKFRNDRKSALTREEAGEYRAMRRTLDVLNRAVAQVDPTAYRFRMQGGRRW